MKRPPNRYIVTLVVEGALAAMLVLLMLLKYMTEDEINLGSQVEPI